MKEIKRGKSPVYDPTGKTLVFAQKCNVKFGGIDMFLSKRLSDEAFSKYPSEEYMIDGDIVINSTGNGTLGRIGIFHDSDRIGDGEVVPDSHVTILRASRHISIDFLYYLLKFYQPFLEKQGSGSTNQTELKPEAISNLMLPLPPFDEQFRIVECLSSSYKSIAALP